MSAVCGSLSDVCRSLYVVFVACAANCWLCLSVRGLHFLVYSLLRAVIRWLSVLLCVFVCLFVYLLVCSSVRLFDCVFVCLCVVAC